MSSERVCGYKLIVRVEGQRKEIVCCPEAYCIRDLIWGTETKKALGAMGAAAQLLEISTKSIQSAGVDGDCIKLKSSR